MRRFFISADHIDTNEGVAILGESDARHISRVLRMVPGGKIIVCDMNGNEYEGMLDKVAEDSVTVKIVASKKNESEPKHRLILYQALPKNDKMDYIVQKSVELGVSEIVPVISERCIVKLTPEAAARKIIRWQKISTEAAKQSGRGSVPKISAIISYGEAVRQTAEGWLSFLCYEGDGTQPIGRFLNEVINNPPVGCEYKLNSDLFDNTVKPPDKEVLFSENAGNAAEDKEDPRDIRFIIGPEGGFGAGEVELAKAAGLALVGLGKRILRCETASAFVLSCVAMKTELQ